VAPALAQINEVLEVASEIRTPVFATIAFTGFRSGDVGRLRVEDVDLEGNWIHVISWPGFETKTGHSRKTPIHPRLRKILDYLQLHKTGWFSKATPSRNIRSGISI
jgi:integrase